jgi:hypothetical protein
MLKACGVESFKVASMSHISKYRHRVPRCLASTITIFVQASLLAFFSTSFVRASECAGVRMPDTVKVKGAILVLNGMGERTATIFSVSVYVGSLYLEKRTHSAKEVLSKTTAKHMVLHFVRDVDQSEMADAIEKGVRKNAGNEAGEAHKQIQKFTKKMPPLKKGMSLFFTYFPGSGLDIWADNVHVITFEDENICEILFRVWFGPEPPNEKLKAGMLGAKCD